MNDRPLALFGLEGSRELAERVAKRLGPVGKPVARRARLVTEHGEARKESGCALRLCEKNRGGTAPIRIVSSVARYFPDARRV